VAKPASKPSSEQFISRRDASARFSISTQWIDKKIRSGELAAFRLGRSVRIRVVDLEAFLKPVVAPEPARNRKAKVRA
jgi:excisionase family DNA binding protein